MAKNTVRLLKVSFICSALALSGGTFANPQNGLMESDVQQLSGEQEKENSVGSVDKTIPVSPVLSINENRKKLQNWLPQQVKPIFFDRLTTLYTVNNMKPLWSDKKAIQQFESQLVELSLAGFQPQFEKWLVQLNSSELSDMGRDIILSDAMLGYLHFVNAVKGKGDSWLYSKTPYKIYLPSPHIIEKWQQHINNSNVLSYIMSLSPNHPMYENMRKEMLEQLSDKQPWTEFLLKSTLRLGQSNENMAALEKILVRSGVLDPSVTNSDNKVYNKALVAAVKRFQTLHGLAADGVIGQSTKTWLNTAPQIRARIMALNIQRLRIIPGDIPTGIFVNIPNYSLDYYLNGKEVLNSKVVVGRPSRKTPIMSSELNNVVINPPWNVPTSMTRKDIAPRAMRDPGYFRTRGYTVFSSWSNDAKVIDSSSINWGVVTPGNFPYRIRQAPGPTNSLGRFKFNMPNSDAIYLHDTPNQTAFNREMRAISSGCVRVNKAPELADMLLGDAGWDKSKVNNSLKTWATKYVSIPKKIPVFLYYQTAWVDKKGIPQYRADIYDYDTSARQQSEILNNILADREKL
ncbi:L,D-transpeptidase [Xenorhabdus nematophila]|uniref:L,D-transpeptidase n=1 Tax=Xenorhabdus nematophila TaxID=628 RepID=UPI0003275DD6|nr:L,D-transpeptidase [Xenorhabdus nematophila]CCW29555.1 putative L,D-transpeptidase YcbB [Xenorhabdus nematophila F1]CEE94447.1 putative carboxypeptidasewith PGDB-like domain [Xenorhabdus nematophila str. Anatoliense]CEE95726.1 putative carboxypeptidasewith PGDB-like domain [Xenorhabdus nematophila str. Anatoliense]